MRKNHLIIFVHFFVKIMKIKCKHEQHIVYTRVNIME